MNATAPNGIFPYHVMLLTCLFRDCCFPDSKSSPNITATLISLAVYPIPNVAFWWPYPYSSSTSRFPKTRSETISSSLRRQCPDVMLTTHYSLVIVNRIIIVYNILNIFYYFYFLSYIIVILCIDHSYCCLCYSLLYP